MGRRLEDERARRLAPLPLLPLEQLEHAPQPAVGGREVLGVEPGAVRRDVARRLGDVREEGVGQEDDLLLGLVHVGGVDREELGGEVAHLLLARLGVGDPRVGLRSGSQPGPRRRLADLPAVARREAAGRSPGPAGAASCPTASCPTTTIGRVDRARRGSRGAAPHQCSGAQPLDEAPAERVPQHDHLPRSLSGASASESSSTAQRLEERLVAEVRGAAPPRVGRAVRVRPFRRTVCVRAVGIGDSLASRPMADNAREIENLIYTYAERIDAGDLTGVAELFAHGRIEAAPDAPALDRGRERVRELYEGSTRLYDDGTPRTST